MRALSSRVVPGLIVQLLRGKLETKEVAGKQQQDQSEDKHGATNDPPRLGHVRARHLPRMAYPDLVEETHHSREGIRPQQRTRRFISAGT